MSPEKIYARLRWIFLGADGLRAGWSLLLFIGILVGFSRGITMVVRHFTHGPHPLSGVAAAWHPVMDEFIGCLIILITTFIMARIERRPLGTYGFGRLGKLPLFLHGLAWGAGSLSALVLALWATGHLVFDGRALGLWPGLGYAALWAVGFMAVGYLEESVMRGYAQFTLARGIAGLLTACGVRVRARAAGFWVTAVLLSFLFGFGHGSNPGESPVGLFMAGAAGLLFCLSLWYTGSLWWALGFHAAWDWAQSYFYGTADSGTSTVGHLFNTHPAGRELWSGGSTGPEGSLLVVPVLLILVLVLRRSARIRGQVE